MSTVDPRKEKPSPARMQVGDATLLAASERGWGCTLRFALLICIRHGYLYLAAGGLFTYLRGQGWL